MPTSNEQRKYYVFCDDNCRFEGMTKEQIISAISAATGLTPAGVDVDAAFITKIKEMNASKQLKFWIGTTAQFNALTETVADTLYIISDDTTFDDLTALFSQFEELTDAFNSLTENVNTKVQELTDALNNLDESVSEDVSGLTTNVNSVNSEIAKIKNGTTEVKKAYYTKYISGYPVIGSSGAAIQKVTNNNFSPPPYSLTFDMFYWLYVCFSDKDGYGMRSCIVPFIFPTGLLEKLSGAVGSKTMDIILPFSEYQTNSNDKAYMLQAVAVGTKNISFKLRMCDIDGWKDYSGTWYIAITNWGYMFDQNGFPQ